MLVPVLGHAQAPPKYTITTVAGNCDIAIANPCPGNYGGDGGPVLNAYLFGPSDVIFDSSGILYISDTVNNRIRQVNFNTGLISLFAGDGTAGYQGDGASAMAKGTNGAELSSPTGIAFDSFGNLYIADYSNFVIREVNTGGIINTVAGDNTLGAGFAGDRGPALSAQLSRPAGVAVDSAGNMYIADPDNDVVRVVCANQTPIACQGVPAGDINTFAGNFAIGANYSGDGGPPTKALLNNPVAVLLDPAGNLYISDSGNSVIRKVTPGPNSIITTVAGNGNFGYSGDKGPATSAELSDPKGLAIDAAGNLYIADHDNSVIRMVEPANGNIYTIAGNHSFGYSGDNGPATSAQLNFPSGVAVYGGNIYIADNQNNVIRMLTPPAPQINAGGVVNGASYTAPVVPGSIASVYGAFSLTSTSIDTDLPLDTSLQNLSFEFGGTAGFGSVGAAPLFYVSGAQANLQVPWEAAGQTGVTLAAALNGAAGASQTVNVAAFAPAIFTLDESGTGPGAIQNSSYQLVNGSNPAIAGTTYIFIYCTGLGAVSANQPATGFPASLDPTKLAPTSNQVTVTIGGITENAEWAGLAPGFVGLYQVNALVPAGVSAGSAVPLTITVGGMTSQDKVTVAVQ